MRGSETATGEAYDVTSCSGQTAGREADLALAARVARGEAAAQRELVDRLLPRARALAGYVSRDAAEADDLAQVGLLEVLGNVRAYRGESRLARWAGRILIRTIMHRVRRRARRESFTELVESDVGIEEDTPDECLLREIMHERLAEHLSRLTELQREAVVLKLVHGHTLAEIADITGVSVNTAKDRLRVGRKKLRGMVTTDPALRDFVSEWRTGCGDRCCGS